MTNIPIFFFEHKSGGRFLPPSLSGYLFFNVGIP
nr:MAG TPA: hypothetical protein [Caudoviricetes sp.]